MSYTPETDAFRDSQFTDRVDEICKLYDFAEKLERERDDALSQIVQAECRAERFCQERDEAREALREAIQFRDTTLNGYDLDAWLKAAGLKP